MLCRMIVVLTGILNLTSCVVADMDSTNHTSVPWIQVFQKVDSTGQTNSHERKEALYIAALIDMKISTTKLGVKYCL
jgi:hypothetical protein